MKNGLVMSRDAISQLRGCIATASMYKFHHEFGQELSKAMCDAINKILHGLAAVEVKWPPDLGPWVKV